MMEKNYPEARSGIPGDQGVNLLSETAQKYFGISYLFPYQHLVISNILRRAGYFGKEEQEEAPLHQLVLLPTGAGKSLCFMLPACLLEGLTIVAFPLLGLMDDQLRRVEEAGMGAVLLKGGMTRKEKETAWQKIHEGKVQMLLTNPEILILQEVRDKLKNVRISHLVLDEAHTIPEWGESFRPACLELGRILPELGAEQITAVTATASPLILEKIKSILFGDLDFNLVRANPDRTNIFYTVKPVLSRMTALTDLVPGMKRPALIFCSTRRQTEQTALYLSQRLDDPDIRFYHAGVSKKLRGELEQWFYKSDTGILIATCAYGMGMDKQNIRTVIHYNLPSSVEAYLQESGRAGRDRQPCQAILLFHPEDREREKNNPNPELRSRYSKLLAFAEDSHTCRRESLLAILEAEPEDCDSCDVCCGSLAAESPLEKGILDILKLHSRCFNQKQFRDYLLGRHCDKLLQGYYHRSRGFGCLQKMNPDEVAEIIGSLMASSLVEEKQKGSWKKKLAVLAEKRI